MQRSRSRDRLHCPHQILRPLLQEDISIDDLIEHHSCEACKRPQNMHTGLFFASIPPPVHGIRDQMPGNVVEIPVAHLTREVECLQLCQ